MMKKLALLLLILGAASTSHASWSRIQRTSFDSSAGSFNVTVPSTGSGHLIVVEEFLTITNCTTAFTAPTDNRGGGSSTYHLDYGPVDPRNTSLCMTFYSTPNCGSGITQLSFTNTGGGDLGGWIEEWSGAATSSPFDQGQNNNQGGTAAWTTNATSTLSGSSDLAIGISQILTANNQTNTPSGGFGDNANANVQGASICIENQALSGTTGVAATGTWNASDGIESAVVTYKASSGAATIIPRRNLGTW